MDIVEKARLIATAAHGAIGQKRKYSFEDYIVHPTAVVDILYAYGINDEATIAAAWLHDVLEDTKLGYSLLSWMMGAKVSDFVYELTDEPGKPGRNRADRKAGDRARLAVASSEVQNIKVADLIDNTSSIVQYDPSFAVVYLKEKALLLDVLTKADESLMERARVQLSESFALLNARNV